MLNKPLLVNKYHWCLRLLLEITSNNGVIILQLFNVTIATLFVY